MSLLNGNSRGSPEPLGPRCVVRAPLLLEQLATETPGLAPGLVARDPLYSGPLADNQRLSREALQRDLFVSQLT